MTWAMRRGAICALGVVCMTHALSGESFSTYRQFELGSNVSSVAAAAGIAASEVTLVHQRPAVLQDLEWRPSRWGVGLSAPSNDPVERMTFSFYNDRLFRIVVEYGMQWTEGMTPPDLVEAISRVYGAPTGRPARNPAQAESRSDIEYGAPIGRWGVAGDHTVVLYQTTSYLGAFRLVVTDVPRADLAAKADTEAKRLDEREAPQREAARENKARADEREAAAKARLANKGDFRP